MQQPQQKKLFEFIIFSPQYLNVLSSKYFSSNSVKETKLQGLYYIKLKYLRDSKSSDLIGLIFVDETVPSNEWLKLAIWLKIGIILRF